MWLARHGLTTAPPGVAIGWSDHPLGEEGLGQARAAAALLAPEPVVAVYSSDLRRCGATAEVIAEPHGLPVRTDPRLRELDFGAWDGRALADLWAEEPAAAAAWERDIMATPPSFGESLSQLWERVAAFWAEIEPAASVIVAHRGSLAALRALATGVGFAESFAAGWEPGAVVRI